RKQHRCTIQQPIHKTSNDIQPPRDLLTAVASTIATSTHTNDCGMLGLCQSHKAQQQSNCTDYRAKRTPMKLLMRAAKHPLVPAGPAETLRYDTIGHNSGNLLFAAASHALLGTLDRKSTRLNSSHVSISYAAFCL